MTEAIKIRAHRGAEFTDLRILLQHPMENGQRKDEQGQVIAALFIRNFTVKLNGKAIINNQLNTSIAKNPLFGFKVKGINPGDTIAVAWEDSSGQRREDAISVP